MRRPITRNQPVKHFIKHVGTVMKHSPASSPYVTIRSDSAGKRIHGNVTREEMMSRTKQEPSRAKQPALANHYRAIGPAAIVAALLHTAKKKKPAQKITSPRAA